jgi:acyl-CoA thioesterase-1
MYRQIGIGCLCLCLWSVTLLAQEPKKPQEDWNVAVDPQLPNVLILGDSISIGYTLQVRKLLAGKANVFRPMNHSGDKPDNCEGTTKAVAELTHWLGDKKWSVIHFNLGLHDMKHVKKAGTAQNSQNPEDPKQADIPQYTANLEKIVEQLQATKAKLIFATTTPVPEGYNKMRDRTDPPLYNAAAVKVMQSHQIPVNDLFAFVEPQLTKWQNAKDVHFKPVGSQALAEQVAAEIQQALAK